MHKYIIIEWIHWSWKSTVADRLQKHIQTNNPHCQRYHFPEENEILWKAIREILTEEHSCHHRQVTGLLYAAAANRLHYMYDNTETMFILDRHSVTSGLIFQKEIDDYTRHQIYWPSITSLQKHGIVIYIQTDIAVAEQRHIARNTELREQQDTVRKNKSNDLFVKQKYKELSDLYEQEFIPKVQALHIPIICVTNNWSIDETIANIMQSL